jgi:tetrahydromethanopterin S-methyltransferase subunit A
MIDRIGLVNSREILKLVNKYKNEGEAYPDEPMVVCSQKKRRSTFADPVSGDVIISEEFVMDASAGIICEAESL